MSSAATASTRWRVRELYCFATYTDSKQNILSSSTGVYKFFTCLTTTDIMLRISNKQTNKQTKKNKKQTKNLQIKKKRTKLTIKQTKKTMSTQPKQPKKETKKNGKRERTIPINYKIK